MKTCSHNCPLQIRLKTSAVGYPSSHFGIQKQAHKHHYGFLMLPLEKPTLIQTTVAKSFTVWPALIFRLGCAGDAGSLKTLRSKIHRVDFQVLTKSIKYRVEFTLWNSGLTLKDSISYVSECHWEVLAIRLLQSYCMKPHSGVKQNSFFIYVWVVLLTLLFILTLQWLGQSKN